MPPFLLLLLGLGGLYVATRTTEAVTPPTPPPAPPSPTPPAPTPASDAPANSPDNSTTKLGDDAVDKAPASTSSYSLSSDDAEGSAPASTSSYSLSSDDAGTTGSTTYSFTPDSELGAAGSSDGGLSSSGTPLVADAAPPKPSSPTLPKSGDLLQAFGSAPTFKKVYTK